MSKAENDVFRIDLKTDPAFAEYREAKAKLDELLVKDSALAVREEALRAAIDDSPRSPDSAMSADDLQRVRELLGDSDESAGNLRELEAELRSVRDDRRVIGVAVAKQRQRVETVESAAKIEIRTRLLPAHRALAQTIVNRLKELRSAFLAEREFTDALDDLGIGFGMPMHTAKIHSLTADKCATIECWLGQFSRGEDRYNLD